MNALHSDAARTGGRAWGEAGIAFYKEDFSHSPMSALEAACVAYVQALLEDPALKDAVTLAIYVHPFDKAAAALEAIALFNRRAVLAVGVPPEEAT